MRMPKEKVFAHNFKQKTKPNQKYQAIAVLCNKVYGNTSGECEGAIHASYWFAESKILGEDFFNNKRKHYTGQILNMAPLAPTLGKNVTEVDVKKYKAPEFYVPGDRIYVKNHHYDTIHKQYLVKLINAGIGNFFYNGENAMVTKMSVVNGKLEIRYTGIGPASNCELVKIKELLRTGWNEHFASIIGESYEYDGSKKIERMEMVDGNVPWDGLFVDRVWRAGDERLSW